MDILEVDGKAITLIPLIAVNMEHYSYGLLPGYLITLISHYATVRTEDISNLHSHIGKVTVCITATGNYSYRHEEAVYHLSYYSLHIYVI